jgi:hypothetical protein
VLPPTWCASVDVWSSDIWSRIRGNTSHVLMYYAIEIDSSLFLSGSSGDIFWVVLDMDLSSLFIVEEPSHRV